MLFAHKKITEKDLLMVIPGIEILFSLLEETPV